MLGGYGHEFERRARVLLSQNPALRHEWRSFPSRFFGDRLDLVMIPPSATAPEVWATLYNSQITIGAGSEDRDFESWGRQMSDDQVGEEAFAAFVELLTEHGYLPR